jgi:hypothetical protein
MTPLTTATIEVASWGRTTQQQIYLMNDNGIHSWQENWEFNDFVSTHSKGNGHQRTDGIPLSFLTRGFHRRVTGKFKSFPGLSFPDIFLIKWWYLWPNADAICHSVDKSMTTSLCSLLITSIMEQTCDKERQDIELEQYWSLFNSRSSASVVRPLKFWSFKGRMRYLIFRNNLV